MQKVQPTMRHFTSPVKERGRACQEVEVHGVDWKDGK